MNTIAHWILLTAFAVGLLLAGIRAQRRGLAVMWLLTRLPMLAMFALAGARLYHVLTPPMSMVARGWTTAYYVSHPLEILLVNQGGLAVFGAWLGLWLGLAFATRLDGQEWSAWSAALTPGLLLALTVGRWADQANQVLYGLPTRGDWGLQIPAERRLPGYETVGFYHPLFLYESLAVLALFGMLLLAEQKGWLRSDRELAFAGLAGYGLLRALLEGLRLDGSMVFGLNINLLIGAAVFVVCGLLALQSARRERNLT